MNPITSIKRCLVKILDYSPKKKLLSNPNVYISKSAKVAVFRNIILKEDSYLEIGHDSMIQGTLVTECAGANILIGSRTFIGGSSLFAASSIDIGDDVLIAWGCTIMDHDAHAIAWSRRSNDVQEWSVGKKDWSHVKIGGVTICDKAWIGANVTILKNVTVGEGAIVGAGSVVTKSIPEWTLWAGNPAKLIRVIPLSER